VQIGGTLPRTPRSHRLAVLAATLLATAACATGPTTSDSGTMPCADLATLDLPGVTSASAELVTSGTAAEMTDLPEFCRVALTIEPQVGAEVWLPTSTYSRRFQAVGGGGFAGVISYPTMAKALRAEDGTVPDRITASKLDNGRVVHTRTLCPYPAAAVYDGTGDPNSETSFACAPRS
jgi:feruloyl esterase